MVAFQRLGLGAKPGGVRRIAADPKAALHAEVKTPGIALVRAPNLPSYAQASSRSQNGFAVSERIFRKEVDARVRKHMQVEIGFVERLVLFWSNHFSMSVEKTDTVRGTIGHFERTVIRPNVLGTFSEMLRGVIAHQAMIAFLDNVDSVGPNSKFGRQHRTGYNENLAREILELHTLGSGGGYSDKDVTALAKMLTGWSYVRGWEADRGWNGGTSRNRGQFIFRPDWHEPGPKTLLGKTYPDAGQGQAERALHDLAIHPATGEHLAFKLVRHFITDRPTAAMVKPIKQAFIRTRGNLKAVAHAVVNLPSTWSAPFTKIRTPYELAIAQYRAMGRAYAADEFWWFTEPLKAMNQSVWHCPSPEGWPDESRAWLNPDGMTIRLDTAQISSWIFGRTFAGTALARAASIYDRGLTPTTRDALTATNDKYDGLTILFTSPEFQRR